MSLERRMSHLQGEHHARISPHKVIQNELKYDYSQLVKRFFERRPHTEFDGRGLFREFENPQYTELVELYELAPIDMPDFSLVKNVAFTRGFHLVTTWYDCIPSVATRQLTDDETQTMDEKLGKMFPDRVVTTQSLQESLIQDPSGVAWLEDMARAEFTEDTLAPFGAYKAITGIRKMYDALTATT